MMKKIILTTIVLLTSILSFAQNKDTDTVKYVLKQYKEAVEKLDGTGTEKLFTTNSRIFESGGNEGSYSHYLEHHLNPELKEFRSFKFNDYKVEITVDGNYAFATETYNYVIVVSKNNKEYKSIGVATTVLKKESGKWKIMISHTSSRK